MSNITKFFIVCVLAILSSTAVTYSVAQSEVFLDTTKRLLVKTEGRQDYFPLIVACESSSVGVCIRDTRGIPANNPVELNSDGTLTVRFNSWEIYYVISSDGTGKTYDFSNTELKPFTWTMIDQ